jgi:amino acid adenylation domain-containing protein
MQASIHSAFDEVAARFGPATAIETSDTSLTYTELWESANKIANRLLEDGAGKGDLVCILADGATAVVPAILGALKAGCAFLPLDVRAPMQRHKAMLAQAHCKWFLAQPTTVTVLDAIARQAGTKNAAFLDLGESGYVPELQSLRTLPGWSQASSADPGVVWDPDGLAYVYFTSGSTGVPKGIAGRAKAIPHFIEWEIRTLGLQPEARVSQLTSPAFDASLRDYFVPLCTGGTVCEPSAEIHADAGRLTQWIEDSRIEVMHCVPSLFRVITQQPLSPQSFPALRWILMAGEVLPPAYVRRWIDVFGERIRLMNMYGPSETTMIKLFHVVNAADALRPSIPVGKPIHGAASLVLDQNCRPCPSGAIGEIYIRTPYASLGYYNQVEATAAAFVPNPLTNDPDDRVYKTGDLGRILPDGDFEYLGRKDQQVKIRGARVELNEVENAVRSYPGVADVTVVDVEDGRGFKTLCAYLVEQSTIELSSLRDFLQSLLPDYMVPSAFVLLSELPRSLNGKVDRRMLPPPTQAGRGAREYVAPRNPVEERLAGIWKEMFGFEQIGIHDDFLALGGHSLLAMQMLSRVRAAFHIELPLRQIFEARTIADLAKLVTEGTITTADKDELADLELLISNMDEEQVAKALEEEMKDAGTGVH